MVPKQSSSKNYCKVCKEDFSDYLEVILYGCSMFNQNRTSGGQRVTSLVVIFWSFKTASNKDKIHLIWNKPKNWNRFLRILWETRTLRCRSRHGIGVLHVQIKARGSTYYSNDNYHIFNGLNKYCSPKIIRRFLWFIVIIIIGWRWMRSTPANILFTTATDKIGELMISMPRWTWVMDVFAQSWTF